MPAITRRWQNPSNSASAATPRSPSETAQTCNSTTWRPSALSKSISRGGSRMRLYAPPGTGFVKQLFEDLIRLRADDAVSRGNKGGNAGYAVLARFRPIGVDRVLEPALGQDLAGFLRSQPDRLRDVDQYVAIADIASLDKIRPVQFVVKRLGARLGIGPFAEVLGQPAVV